MRPIFSSKFPMHDNVDLYYFGKIEEIMDLSHIHLAVKKAGVFNNQYFCQNKFGDFFCQLSKSYQGKHLRCYWQYKLFHL